MVDKMAENWVAKMVECLVALSVEYSVDKHTRCYQIADKIQ